MKRSKKKNKMSAEKLKDRRYKNLHARYERISIIVILPVIIIAGLCLILLQRPVKSESEKRELAKMPEFSFESYFSGSFTQEFTKYFSDTVPGRESLIKLAAWFNEHKGINAPTFYGNVSVVADDKGQSISQTENTASEQTEPPENTLPDEPQEITTAPAEELPEETAITTAPPLTEPETQTTQTEEEEVENIAEFNNNGIIVDGVEMYGDCAGVMLFGGNAAAGKRYAEVISAYKQALGDDVNVYNMVVPTSVEFYLPSKYQRYSASEKDAIDNIYSSYTADVIPIDAYSEIAAHTDEYIYLRTDHHWSQRGAYYAYKAFANLLGQTPPALEDYETGTKDGFVGSLYGYTNDSRLKNSPEIFTYYKPTSEYTAYYYKYDTLEENGVGTMFYDSASGSNCYGMFLGGDALHIKAVTKLETGRKIAVFKESYGNAFAPFLVDSFDEVYVIDIRYFGTNAIDYIKENGITDVLFINNAFAANTDSLISCIEKLLVNPYGSLDSLPQTDNVSETQLSTEETE